MLSILIKGQKNYGKEYSIGDVFDYFKMKLESKYTVNQVMYAIDKYTDSKNDIPAPSDIINILNPEKPRVTEAQFVQAQKWQERNGYPKFSDAWGIIDDYRTQDLVQKEAFKLECDKIKSLVSNSIKRIN